MSYELTYREEDNLLAAVVLMEELTLCQKDAPVRLQFNEMCEAHGSIGAKALLCEFAVRTEEYLSELPDEERENLFEVGAWDLEWLPAIMHILAEKTMNWLAGGVEMIKFATEQWLLEKQEERNV